MSEDTLLELHKYYKYNSKSYNSNMIGFMISLISGAFAALLLDFTKDSNLNNISSLVMFIVLVFILGFSVAFLIYNLVNDSVKYKNVYFDAIVAKHIEDKLKKDFLSYDLIQK